jgi:hypothetical protein
MSLVDDGTSGFAADKVLDADRALYGLFEGADRLDLHGYKRFELPATTLTSGCYFSMFKGCTRLTRVIPNLLPATTMASDCYQSMFEGCISLAKLPENLLPATSLANACYQSMFKNCISLTSVPENLLPATSLANSCYFRMFENCNKLQKAPVLPANDMVMLCYAYMFTKCRNLQEVTCLATTSQYGSNMGWLDNAGTSVTGTKIFVVNSGFSIDNPTTDMPKDGGAYTVWGSSRSTSSIPALWTVQN